jgi:hypothetical protein
MLYKILQPLPNLLVALRRHMNMLSIDQKALALRKANVIRLQLQTWRQSPAYEMFDTFLNSTSGKLSLGASTIVAIKGLGLVCSYPSMMILVNLVIKGFSDDDCSTLDAENDCLSNEICQLYLSNMATAPPGNSYMAFELQLALSVAVEQKKKDWITEVMKNKASAG